MIWFVGIVLYVLIGFGVCLFWKEGNDLSEFIPLSILLVITWPVLFLAALATVTGIAVVVFIACLLLVLLWPVWVLVRMKELRDERRRP